jgi:hypothetical protein
MEEAWPHRQDLDVARINTQLGGVVVIPTAESQLRQQPLDRLRSPQFVYKAHLPMRVCVCCSSPTLSPTDSVPRGLLTLALTSLSVYTRKHT